MRRLGWMIAIVVGASIGAGGTPAIAGDAEPTSAPAAHPTAPAAHPTAPASAGAGDEADGPIDDAPIVDLTEEGGRALAPGRYRDTSLGLEVSFDVAEGWTHAVSVPGAGLALVRDEPGAPYFAITQFDGTVFTAPCTTADDPGPPGTETIEASAAAFMAHLVAHPFLTLVGPTPFDLAGTRALQADVQVSVPVDCDPPWAWLWGLPIVRDYHMTDGQLARLIAFEAGGRTIVAVAEAYPEADYASFLRAAMGVLESMVVADLR